MPKVGFEPQENLKDRYKRTQKIEKRIRKIEKNWKIEKNPKNRKNLRKIIIIDREDYIKT